MGIHAPPTLNAEKLFWDFALSQFRASVRGSVFFSCKNTSPFQKELVFLLKTIQFGTHVVPFVPIREINQLTNWFYQTKSLCWISNIRWHKMVKIDWKWVEGIVSSDVIVGHIWHNFRFVRNNKHIFKKNVFLAFVLQNCPILVKNHGPPPHGIRLLASFEKDHNNAWGSRTGSNRHMSWVGAPRFFRAYSWWLHSR